MSPLERIRFGHGDESERTRVLTLSSAAPIFCNTTLGALFLLNGVGLLEETITSQRKLSRGQHRQQCDQPVPAESALPKVSPFNVMMCSRLRRSIAQTI